MKRIAFFTAVLIWIAGIGFAADEPVQYPEKVWSAVQTYDVAILGKSLDAHTRELIAAKFSFRGKDIRHLKPNWYQSSIWQPIPSESGKFAHVPVMVARTDVEAFKSFPTNSTGAECTVYGRVEYEIATNYRFLRLLGRKATPDNAGNVTVTW